MTGNQLGRAIGLNKAFGTRITQYETNARTGNLKKIADVLNISLLSISPLFGDMPEEFMEILFWLDEEFWIAFSHHKYTSVTHINRNQDFLTGMSSNRTFP